METPQTHYKKINQKIFSMNLTINNNSQFIAYLRKYLYFLVVQELTFYLLIYYFLSQLQERFLRVIKLIKKYEFTGASLGADDEDEGKEDDEDEEFTPVGN